MSEAKRQRVKRCSSLWFNCVPADFVLQRAYGSGVGAAFPIRVTAFVEPTLSTPMAMRLPMRWIALLYGRIGANLAATSGIHHGVDALKMIMAGADVTMLCSVLLRRGIDHIRVIEREMREWMEEHEYESVEQLTGSMSQKNCPDPSAFERAQYMRALETYPAADV